MTIKWWAIHIKVNKKTYACRIIQSSLRDFKKRPQLFISWIALCTG